MKKRKIRAKLPYPKNVQDPEQLFALICFDNYIKGQLGEKIPGNESREAYKELERLILYYKT